MTNFPSGFRCLLHQHRWYPRRVSGLYRVIWQPATQAPILPTCPTENAMPFRRPSRGQHTPYNPCVTTLENSFCRSNHWSTSILHREVSQCASIRATNHPQVIFLIRIVTINEIINLSSITQPANQHASKKKATINWTNSAFLCFKVRSFFSNARLRQVPFFSYIKVLWFTPM